MIWYMSHAVAIDAAEPFFSSVWWDIPVSFRNRPKVGMAQ